MRRGQDASPGKEGPAPGSLGPRAAGTESTESVVRRYYDAFSADYDRPRGGGYHALVDELEVAAVAPWLPGAAVLEIGCGTGLVARRLEAAGAARVVGVDLSLGMLRKAEGRRVIRVQGSASSLPFRDAAFDLVCSFKVLPHVPDLDAALSEARRVVRPGGVLALELYNRFSLRHLARWVAGSRRTSATTREADIPTRWHTPAEARQWIRDAGLEWIGVRGIRVALPAAAIVRWPGIGGWMTAVERRLSRSPGGRLGGFLVVLARRRD